MTPSPPSDSDPAAQSTPDTEQLSLLSTFHYIVGGLYMLMSCVFIVLIMAGFDQLRQHPERRRLDDLLIISGYLAIALGWIVSGLMMISAYCIDRRRARKFTLYYSFVSFFLFPFGTLLAISTFFILPRSSIKLLYSNK